MAEPFKFETLNTSYVNLVALIRYLRANDFIGRLHVSLSDYEADVFLYGKEPPSVWEKDQATGHTDQGEQALQRLLVRAREPGGLITVFQDVPRESGQELVGDGPRRDSEQAVSNDPSAQLGISDVVSVSNELISAVKRAVESAGLSFSEPFFQARVALGDDYPFLDPTTGHFEYQNAEVNLQSIPASSAYSQGISEALREVVRIVAQQRGENSFRQLVAVELANLARRRPEGLHEFSTQLDHIAGTRVL